MNITKNAILEWINVFASEIATNKEYLTQLDAAIGDADHGENMDRGFKAVISKMSLLKNQDIGEIMKTIAMTLISTVGGASGPLYGTLFLKMNSKTIGKTELTPNEFGEALAAGLEGIKERGKATIGDKTMIDCLQPAIEIFRKSINNNVDLDKALNLTDKAANDGMIATIPLTARKGRASYLGERSAGHQDPGATSAYLLIKAALVAFTKQ